MGRSGTLPSKPILPTAGAAPVRQQQQQQRSGGGGCKCGGTCCGGSGRQQQQQWQEGPHDMGGSTGGGHRECLTAPPLLKACYATESDSSALSRR